MRIAVLTLLAASVSAQWSQVAPAHYDAWEGTTVSSAPFSGTSFPVRLQQVHIEPKGAVHTIASLAFRRDGRLGDPRFQGRTVDMEMQMGHGALASVSASFAGNYLSPPQTTLARRVVQTPDYSAGARQAPAAFDFVLPLDVPFAHNGVDDFVWDITVHGAGGTGTAVALDAVISGFNLVIPANYELNGTGCTYAGNEILLRPNVSLQGFPVNGWILDWAATACPPGTNGVFLLGTVDPDLPFPGLCTNVHVLPLVQVPGVSDANGGYAPFPSTSPLPRIPQSGAGVGLRLEAQLVLLQAGPPLQLLASNGASAVLPPPTPMVGIARVLQTPTSGPTLSTTTGVVVRLAD
ncbi:MAG: hypothetical protein R3F56_15700 [Planctomycetota bacterium]